MIWGGLTVSAPREDATAIGVLALTDLWPRPEPRTVHTDENLEEAVSSWKPVLGWLVCRGPD